MTNNTQNLAEENADDNTVPPVARVFGLAVSEWVTYSFIVISVAAVIFGHIVGGERDVQAERAMATLANLSATAERQFASSGELICDNRLLDATSLANDYLTLSVRPAPFKEDDKGLGYGPALYVDVVEDKVSGDTWDTAKRLMKLVEETGEKAAKEEQAANTPRLAVASVEAVDEAEDDKPKNQLREVQKTGFEEDHEYLRYYILASEVATCQIEV